MAKNKIHSTTQDFTEIVDISDDIVFLKGGNACMIAECSSVNFFLLSQDEQNARIYGYMALLNSLSSYIQILIVSRRIDLGAYIKLIEDKIANVRNPKVGEQLTLYRDFIRELVKGEGLLDKKIFVIIPFSQLELGAVNMAQNAGGSSAQKNLSLNERIKSGLISKRNNVLTQVERIGLTARPLNTNELLKLLRDTGLASPETIETLLREVNELSNMIAAGVLKLKAKNF